jgi:poly-gamma-glutamate synthesis protein (capsule biosynthesis protein)
VLAGSSDRYDSLALVESEADAILAALGVQRPGQASRLTLAPDARRLAADLAQERKHLAFLRADDVDESVRALGWGDEALFGVDRVGSLAEWPLTASLPARDAAAGTYDPGSAWTLFAGGDILLDRGVAKTVKVDGKGVDFPFDGGTAEITSRYCCSSFGWELPRTRRTGGEGAMRNLISRADIAIANFENPAPDRFTYHTSGVVFSADPKLIEGLANAGIDWVSLANNHIRDAGAGGIADTRENLDEWGIRYGGAGANEAEAREPSILEAGGIEVAILGYDTVARYYRATRNGAGSAQLSRNVVRQDVEAARSAGADLIIVFPHWGTEYDATPFGGQRELAEATVEAGADLIIGNHAHWAGALEIHEGKPIWYALGNFVFDQVWSEPTMEGMTLELTFQGADLRQIVMRPHIILDRSQPNFLDPAGDGRVVMGQVYDASRGLLDW